MPVQAAAWVAACLLCVHADVAFERKVWNGQSPQNRE